jgi:hypothetical protein
MTFRCGALKISISDPDPHSMAAWIRIPNADPGGLKSAKREGKKRIQKTDN